MNKINWALYALNSEIEYSKALGGIPNVYDNFIHIHNPFVPWCSDFNRAVGIKARTLEELDHVINKVKELHTLYKLNQPNRYDFDPQACVKKSWQNYFQENNFTTSSAIFFKSKSIITPLNIEFYLPTEHEFIRWYYTQQKERDYFDIKWFNELKPLKLRLIRVFKPHWLMSKNEIVGWVYFANLGEYARLFEVEIAERHQGKGYGKILLAAVKSKAKQLGLKYVLLQSNENLRTFYEKCGFEECSRNITLWHK